MPSYANQTTRLQKQSLPHFPTQTSFTQLFGDTFATNPASSLYLLENLNSAVGGTVLTNNNAATFESTTDLIINQIDTVTLDGVNQYLSLPTEASVQVGVGSFVASCWFKTSSLGSSEYVFQVGDAGGGQQNWGLLNTNLNVMRAEIDDGTTSAVADDPTPNRWNDDKWHLGTMVVDRNPNVNLMTLLVDGEQLASTDISGVANTLTNGTHGLHLGAIFVGGAPSQFWDGQESNFSLYIADAADNTVPPDYNLPSLLEAGLRENASVGTITVGVNSNLRLNNSLFNFPADDGDFVTSVINTSEGIYDLLVLSNNGATYGIMEMDIDGKNVFTQDLYAGSTVNNVQYSETGLYLSAGTHILKVKVNGNNVSSTDHIFEFNMIELIKRDGANEGDSESTTGSIFSDEIIQRTNAAFAASIEGARVFNQRFFESPSTTGNFTEGDIFIKKGQYNITINADQATSRAAFNLWFGGVKVLDEDTFWDDLTANNVPKTVSVFLEGGKTTVRWETGNTATGTFSGFNYIKYELVTGKSNGDNVNIWAADDDFGVVSGVTPELSDDISERFNQNRAQNISNDALNDEILYPRYFSGGTYKVKWLTVPTSLGGVCDVFWDEATNLIFDNTSLNSVGGSTIHETTVTIPRGLRDIHIKTIADGGTNAFLYIFTLMQFTKIADVESTEDDNSDPVHGSTVPLGHYIETQTNGDVTLNFGGVDLKNKYSKVLVTVTGEYITAADVNAQISGETTFYNQDGNAVVTGTQSGINLSDTSQLRLLSSALNDGGSRHTVSKVEVFLVRDEGVGDILTGFWRGGSALLGQEDGVFSLTGANHTKFTSFRLFLAGDWRPELEIFVEGVLR